MSRGILSGVVGGAVVGGVVASVLSLIAPLPGEQVAVAEPETQTEVPEPSTEDTPAVEAPVEDAVEPAEEDDQAAVDAPEEPQPDAQLDAPAAIAGVDGVDEASAPAPSSDPAVTSGQAPALPDDEAEVAVTTPDAPNAPTALATEADAPDQPAQGGDLPQVSALSDAPETGSEGSSGLALPQVDTAPDADAETAPRVVAATPEPAAEATTVSADTPIVLPVPEIENPVAGVVTNRLPSVVAPSADASQDEAVTEDAALDAAEVGALKAYAAAYEGEPAAGLMSVILIDSGADGMKRSELVKLSFPFSVAIDPSLPDAAQVAAEYRAAGIEVLAMVGDLPASAAAGDVAVALEGYFDVLSEAIAVMDPLDARIQSNRSLLQPVLGTIRDTGHGLVTYDRGLNTAQQAARREGIAAATVFRLLDADLEEGPKIKRYLSRAAFTASKDGSVVVLGRSYAETVKALLEWSLDEKGGDLAIVPVSQVMLQDLG